MKLGQMASYVDEALPGPLREALAQLQSNAPPMSAELAAQVIEHDLGARPEQLFVEWDPEPIAAASIGQVHRAVVLDPVTGHGAGRRGEGAVPGRRRGGGRRPAQRRPAGHDCCSRASAG